MKRKIFKTFWALKSLFQIFYLLLHYVSFLFFSFFFIISLLKWTSSWLRADHHNPLGKGKQDRNETGFSNFFFLQIFDCKGGTWSKGAENSPETWEKVSQRDWYPKMPKATGYLETPWPWNLCDLTNHVCWNCLSDCSENRHFSTIALMCSLFPILEEKRNFSPTRWTSESLLRLAQDG